MADDRGFNAETLTGRSRAHIVQRDDPRFAAHPEAAEAFLAMRAAAAADGVDLRPFSSFRDLKTQARIWNRKLRLEAPLYDAGGRPMHGAAMSEDERIWAILGWSAAPAMSRHHWGTEIDVVDGAAVDGGHRVDLLPYETAPGGPFHALRLWLDENIGRFGFYRPYDRQRGGMNPEPWHLSFAPAAQEAFATLDAEMIEAALATIDLVCADRLSALLPEILERHVRNVAEPAL